MGYVDGFVLAIPKRNLRAYRSLARETGKLWRKYGALDYKECIGDDLNIPQGGIPFPRMVRLKKGETVVFSYIVYKSRAHRDRVHAKVMKDPYMTDLKWNERSMPFDTRRVSFGGFKIIVDA